MLTPKGILRLANSIPLRIPPSPPVLSRKFSSFPPPKPHNLAQFPSRTSRRILPLTPIRFNSTSTSATPTPPPLPETSPPAFLPDYIPTVDSISAPLPTSEHIGFLKEFGLDYGYGFSSLVQSLLEHVHIYTGTPWYGSIITTVAVIRLLQFPFYLKMSDSAARMKELNPFTIPIVKRIREHQTNSDTAGMIAAKNELSRVYKVAGVKRLWLFFPITQIPVFYGFYKNLRGMSEIPIPGLVEGGIGWFTDLTVNDPFYLLPVMTSATLFTQLYMGGEAGANNQSENIRRTLLISLPAITFIFTSNWPAILTFYFLCNSAISLLQTVALKTAWVREIFGLYPLPKDPVPNPLSPVVNKAPADNTETARQIGGRGSWLDRITGGAKEKGGDSEKGFLKSRSDKSKHKAYEESRAARLEVEKRLAREKRERKKRMKEDKGTVE